MYQFSADINYRAAFWWDKKLIDDLNWATLPAAAKAIWPVIASFANEHGASFPSERTIAILCGRRDKCVRGGIIALDGFPPLTIEPYTTKYGRRSKRFRVKFPPRQKGRSFPFHQSILESGFWQELKPTAQALYPAMRSLARTDFQDILAEDDDVDAEDPSDAFARRLYDRYEEPNYTLLARRAGIEYRSVWAALADLEQNHLIREAEDGDRAWLVHLHPLSGDPDAPYIFLKRDYLNVKVEKRYRTGRKKTPVRVGKKRGQVGKNRPRTGKKAPGSMSVVSIE